MEHEQHGLRARLLVLLLSLSNSDQVRQQEDAGSDEDNENIKIYEIIQNPRSEITKAAKKAAEIKALLAEGEEPCRHFYSDDSDLSDWSEDENEMEPNFPWRFDRKISTEQQQQIGQTFVRKPITHLPGVSKPLEPPKPTQELDDYKVEMSLHDAKEWLESNLIPPYWVEEADARSNIHSKFYY